MARKTEEWHGSGCGNAGAVVHVRRATYLRTSRRHDKSIGTSSSLPQGRLCLEIRSAHCAGRGRSRGPAATKDRTCASPCKLLANDGVAPSSAKLVVLSLCQKAVKFGAIPQPRASVVQSISGANQRPRKRPRASTPARIGSSCSDADVVPLHSRSLRLPAHAVASGGIR